MNINSTLQRITDLCCCVNAFEGYFMDQPCKYDKIYWRQRGAMTSAIMDLALALVKRGVPMCKLDKALHRGGWDDNYFVLTRKNNLKIKYKV